MSYTGFRPFFNEKVLISIKINKKRSYILFYFWSNNLMVKFSLFKMNIDEVLRI
jgi:hypothetical protein